MSFFRIANAALVVSALLVIAALVTLFTPGPRLSIEFTGGTLMELRLPEGKTPDDTLTSLRSFDASLAGGAITSTTKDGTLFLRTPTITNEQHQEILKRFSTDLGEVQELQFTTIGPTVGASLRNRAIAALSIAALAIILYLAIVFRSLPQSVSSWSFGIAAIVALAHDLLITVGIFTILSYTTSFQMDTLFVTALLSIMGYSVNDTIVIFDRIRDNLVTEGKRRSFPDIAASSLSQTLRRTLNTGIGALVMLFALFIIGAESIRWFTLTLIVGTLIGTYSSFFVATPLVVLWQQRKKG
jgi:preprotein translocase subunit SecF